LSLVWITEVCDIGFLLPLESLEVRFRFVVVGQGQKLALEAGHTWRQAKTTKPGSWDLKILIAMGMLVALV